MKTTNTFSTDISGKDNVKKENITPFLKFTSFLFPGYVVVAMVIVINCAIGGFSWADLVWYFFNCNCPITANCPITLSDYNFTEWLVKNKAADARKISIKRWMKINICLQLGFQKWLHLFPFSYGATPQLQHNV